MTDEERAERNEVIRKVLVVLQNRILHFSPEFYEAFALATRLDIKAVEVLEYAREHTKRNS